MKNIFLYITILSLFFPAFSCSNEFLYDNIEQEFIHSGDSEIIISPDWDMDDYQFICINAGNADFTVKNAPKWLEVETTSGKLTPVEHEYIVANQQSVGRIRCKAKKNPEFEKTGIYLDKIEISVNGNIYNIPVAYISEGNPKIEVNKTLTVSYNSYYFYLDIRNSGEGILLWDILSMPEWLTVDMDNLNLNGIIIPQGGSYRLPLTFNYNNSLTRNFTGNIVLKTNDKSNPQVTINVIADLGTPQLNIYNNSVIDFGKTETNQTFSFSNQGNGILLWSFSELPEWISVSKSNGLLYPYYSENITFSCNRSLVPEGISTVTIYLNSNDASKIKTAITIKIRNSTSNPANVIGIDGNVIDACYNKNTDILYYVTSQPNKFIAYNAKTKNIANEIALSKAPTCLAVSEDFTKAVIGHGGTVSYLDLQNYSIIKTIEITGVVSDIEFAKNEWIAYTESGNYNIQWTTIYWVNLNSGAVERGSQIYEDCIIKKIPGQDYIIGAETELTSGLYVYDINTRTEKASLSESISNFWFAGNYIVSRNGDVFRISDIISKNGWYNPEGIPSIGRLQFPNSYYYYGASFIDYSPAKKSLFGLIREDWDNILTQIFQFDDNDYSLINTYNYTDYYIKSGTDYDAHAHYIFSNGAGTELYVIRNAKNTTAWSIEFIKLTN